MTLWLCIAQGLRRGRRGTAAQRTGWPLGKEATARPRGCSRAHQGVSLADVGHSVPNKTGLRSPAPAR
jgi:hypothetical protein